MLTVLLAACGGGGGSAPAFALLGVDVVGRPGNVAVATGGDEARVLGEHFQPGAEVWLGGTPAAETTYVGASEIRVVLPPLSPGLVDVIVRNPDGSETILPGALDLRLPPRVDAVVATAGPTQGEARADGGGGTPMEISGAWLQPGADVTVGGLPVAVTGDASTLRFVAPAWPREGESVRVEVSTFGNFLGSRDDAFAYTDEFSLAPAPDALDRARAHHLLRRAAFTAPPAEVDRAVGEGLARTLDRLFTVVASPEVDAEAAALFDEFPPRINLRTRTIQEWWLTHLRMSPNQLRERVAYFLHTHFATGDRGFNEFDRWWLFEQVQLFRHMAFGSWRDLCVAVCKDRAMLHWLDGLVSTANDPNENFARELWELYMLGADNGYGEPDVKEAARAFTGFRRIRRPESFDIVTYDPDLHDPEPKTILGETGRFGYDDNLDLDPRDADGGVVDLTLRRRPQEAARFLCRNLFEFFVYTEPHPLVVAALAEELIAGGWELEPVLRRLLASRALFSARARKGLMRSPVEFAVGFLRATELDMTPSALRVSLDHMGQSLLQPPDVGGWPGGAAWLGSQAFLNRTNFINTAVAPLVDEPDVARLLPAERTPAAIVDALADRLGVELTPLARGEFIEYVTAYEHGGQMKREEFDPADGPRTATKTRGLLYLLGQYPEAHVE